MSEVSVDLYAMKDFFKFGLFLSLFFAVVIEFPAQSKKPKKPVKIKKTGAVVTLAPAPTLETPVETPSVKTNERPVDETLTEVKRNSRDVANTRTASVPVYFYEFTRPGFTYPRILVEHDDAGKGKIAFLKDGSEELISDPINLSALTISKIEEALSALSFIDSTENYQYSRDYSHMGNTQITVRKNGRERTVKYNWTENKNAKVLMDEYRRIANEYTWRFEISVARENQQLQTPAIMDALDSYLKRSEISDPAHMLPFLTGLTTDERLPLIARNHAVKIIKQIEKNKK